MRNEAGIEAYAMRLLYIPLRHTSTSTSTDLRVSQTTRHHRKTERNKERLLFSSREEWIKLILISDWF